MPKSILVEHCQLTGEQEGDLVNQSMTLFPADVSIPAEKTKEPASPVSYHPGTRDAGFALAPVVRPLEIRAPTREEGGRSTLFSLPLATLRERRRERTIRRPPCFVLTFLNGTSQPGVASAIKR